LFYGIIEFHIGEYWNNCCIDQYNSCSTPLSSLTSLFDMSFHSKVVVFPSLNPQ
jgi:hypothetical protein